MKLRITAKLKKASDEKVNELWGYPGTDMTWHIVEFPNHETSIQITDDDGDFIKFHDLSVFKQKLDWLDAEALKRHVDLNGSDEFYNPKPQTAIEFSKLNNEPSDGDWGWYANDLKFNWLHPEPEKTNGAAIVITDPEGYSLTFNGLKVFRRAIEQVEAFAKSHGLILNIGQDEEFTSFSDKDKEELKNLGIKAKKASR